MNYASSAWNCCWILIKQLIGASVWTEQQQRNDKLKVAVLSSVADNVAAHPPERPWNALGASAWPWPLTFLTAAREQWILLQGSHVSPLLKNPDQ